MTTVGEMLVAQLAGLGVDTVFGIPGVHTVELYRGLASSGIRHVTPRHEQGAGFMADGYARVSGRPGVAFVITGPGLTNTLTAIGQARADSVPMLVVSGVNTLPSLGKGLGYLHELPDQRAMMRTVALTSQRVASDEDLLPALEAAFRPFSSQRPGPTHIEVPLDVAGTEFGADIRTEIDAPTSLFTPARPPEPDKNSIATAAKILSDAKKPVILAGGGVRMSGETMRLLAEKLDAPVVQTINARGLMHAHPLGVPASPSLNAVRDLIEDADAVLAVGTELGPTDYDMYATGTMPRMANLVRIDICPDQLARHPAALTIQGDGTDALAQLDHAIGTSRNNGTGAARAARTRTRAFDEIGPDMQACTLLLNAARNTLPNALLVGDSTQPVYAGNLYFDHDRAGGWFNAATGFGALGYAIPAAIGAALADNESPVICLVGDGGAQFTLPEMMTAQDETLPIVFVIWNNHGYQEIETSMRAAGVSPVGCSPTPPDFRAVAASCRMPYRACTPDVASFVPALRDAAALTGPAIIEIHPLAPSASN